MQVIKKKNMKKTVKKVTNAKVLIVDADGDVYEKVDRNPEVNENNLAISNVAFYGRTSHFITTEIIKITCKYDKYGPLKQAETDCILVALMYRMKGSILAQIEFNKPDFDRLYNVLAKSEFPSKKIINKVFNLVKLITWGFKSTRYDYNRATGARISIDTYCGIKYILDDWVKRDMKFTNEQNNILYQREIINDITKLKSITDAAVLIILNKLPSSNINSGAPKKSYKNIKIIHDVIDKIDNISCFKEILLKVIDKCSCSKLYEEIIRKLIKSQKSILSQTILTTIRNIRDVFDEEEAVLLFKHLVSLVDKITLTHGFSGILRIYHTLSKENSDILVNDILSKCDWNNKILCIMHASSYDDIYPYFEKLIDQNIEKRDEFVALVLKSLEYTKIISRKDGMYDKNYFCGSDDFKYGTYYDSDSDSDYDYDSEADSDYDSDKDKDKDVNDYMDGSVHYLKNIKNTSAYKFINILHTKMHLNSNDFILERPKVYFLLRQLKITPTYETLKIACINPNKYVIVDIINSKVLPTKECLNNIISSKCHNKCFYMKLFKSYGIGIDDLVIKAYISSASIHEMQRFSVNKELDNLGISKTKEMYDFLCAYEFQTCYEANEFGVTKDYNKFNTLLIKYNKI